MELQLELFDFEGEQGLSVPAPKISSRKASKKRKRLPKELFDIMDALQSPIIVYPSSWKDTIPRRIFDEILTARMISLMKNQRTATIPEVVAYMYPSSLEFPLNHHWTNIYLWVCDKYMQDFHGFNKEQTDLAPENLDDYEMGMLNRLRLWIYEKRRQALRKRI